MKSSRSRCSWEKVRIDSCGLILFKFLMNDADGSDRLGTFSTVADPSASDISTRNTVDGSHVSHTSNHFFSTLPFYSTTSSLKWTIKGVLVCVDDPSRVPEANILPDAKLNYSIPGIDVGLRSISAASSTAHVRGVPTSLRMY